MTVKENQIIKPTELAKILGITDRHVRNLANEGVIKKTEKGKYLFVESIQGYIEYLETKNEADVSLKDEKIKEEIKKIKKDTELKALRVSELKNQLHSAGIIESVMTNMLVALKGKLLSISNKLAPAVIACDNLGEIQDIIHNEVLDTLDELSDYDSEIFKNKNYVEEDEEMEVLKKSTEKKSVSRKGSKNEKSKSKKRGRPKKSK